MAVTLLPGPFANADPRADFIDLGAWVRVCVEAVRPAAEGKGLVLRCEVDPDLPRHDIGDRPRLRQVVLNLLLNAIRSTARGWISICVEAAWDDPRTAAISITDTGAGMTAAELVEARARADGNGGAALGLGLAISGELARRMGGTLTLASECGKGTRAELRVPLLRVPRPGGGTMEIVAAIPATLPPRLGRSGTVRTDRRRRNASGMAPPPPDGIERRRV